nr:phosphotransferase [Propionicimonas sp.]
MFVDTEIAPGVVTRALTPEEASESRGWREALLPGLEPDAVARFIDPRLDKVYSVFAMAAGSRRLVVKQAEGNEVAVYRSHLDGRGLPVPELLRVADVDGATWLLFESFPGGDLQRCSIGQARDAGRAVGQIAASGWSERGGSPDATAAYLATLDRDRDVLEDLPEVRRAYAVLAHRAETGPWALAEADLLPINVLHDGQRACVIDWGYGEVLPVMLDPGRFLAHGGPGESSMFVHEDGVRSTFLAAWLDEVCSRVDTALTSDLMTRDVMLEHVHQHVECFRWVRRLLAAGEQLPDRYDPDRDLYSHLEAARRFACEALN